MTETINKFVVLAICGKSASGKDHLLRNIECFSKKNDTVNINRLVKYTTRPKRSYEVDGVDYNFVTDEEFRVMQEMGLLIESTEFNSWKYGTSINSLSIDSLNVGIFDPDGIKVLSYLSDIVTIPVYLECHWTERLRRSVNREGKFKLEYIRRLIVDTLAFFEVPHHIVFPIPWIIVNSEVKVCPSNLLARAYDSYHRYVTFLRKNNIEIKERI